MPDPRYMNNLRTITRNAPAMPVSQRQRLASLGGFAQREGVDIGMYGDRNKEGYGLMLEDLDARLPDEPAPSGQNARPFATPVAQERPVMFSADVMSPEISSITFRAWRTRPWVRGRTNWIPAWRRAVRCAACSMSSRLSACGGVLVAASSATAVRRPTEDPIQRLIDRGDLVEKALTSVGITQERVEKPLGAGTELKKILKKFGIEATSNCSCNAKAKLMDDQGVEWCENNIEIIVEWLKEEANKRGLHFIDIAGRILVKKAIKNARKNTNK